MIEIETDGNMSLYGEANCKLQDAYVDLYEGTYDYEHDFDIVEDLIHTIRSYDNMRRRVIINYYNSGGL